MSRLWKNWTVHNVLARPLSEIVYWLARPFGKPAADKASGLIHDATLPEVS